MRPRVTTPRLCAVGRDAAGGQPADGRVPLPDDGVHGREEARRDDVQGQLHSVWRRVGHRRQTVV